jgi:hypothetical protein
VKKIKFFPRNNSKDLLKRKDKGGPADGLSFLQQLVLL